MTGKTTASKKRRLQIDAVYGPRDAREFSPWRRYEVTCLNARAAATSTPFSHKRRAAKEPHLSAIPGDKDESRESFRDGPSKQLSAEVHTRGRCY